MEEKDVKCGTANTFAKSFKKKKNSSKYSSVFIEHMHVLLFKHLQAYVLYFLFIYLFIFTCTSVSKT